MDSGQGQSSELTFWSTKRKRGVSPAQSAVAEPTILGRGRRKKSKTQKAEEMSKTNRDSTAPMSNSTMNRDSTASVDTDNIHQAQEAQRNTASSEIEIRLRGYFSESPNTHSTNPSAGTQTTLKIKFKPSFSLNNYNATQKAREILEKRGEPVANVSKQVIKLHMKRTNADMENTAEQFTMGISDSHSLNPETTTTVVSGPKPVPTSTSLPIRPRRRTAQEKRKYYVDLDDSGSNYSDTGSVVVVGARRRKVQKKKSSEDKLTESDRDSLELDSPAPIESVPKPTLLPEPAPRRGRGRPRKVPAASTSTAHTATTSQPPSARTRAPRRSGRPPRIVVPKKQPFDIDLDRANRVTKSGPYETTAPTTSGVVGLDAQLYPAEHLMRYLKTFEPLTHGKSAYAAFVLEKLTVEYKWLHDPGMISPDLVMLTKNFWFAYGNGNWASMVDEQLPELRMRSEKASFRPYSVSGVTQNSGVWLERQE